MLHKPPKCVPNKREFRGDFKAVHVLCFPRCVVISHEHILQYSHTFTAGTCTIWKPLKLVAFTFVLQGKKVVFYVNIAPTDFIFQCVGREKHILNKKPSVRRRNKFVIAVFPLKCLTNQPKSGRW